MLLVDCIDQHGLGRTFVGKQVSVGAGGLIEELFEQQVLVHELASPRVS